MERDEDHEDDDERFHWVPIFEEQQDGEGGGEGRHLISQNDVEKSNQIVVWPLSFVVRNNHGWISRWLNWLISISYI